MTAIDTAVLVSTDDPIMTIIIIFVPIHQNKNNPRYYQLICSPIYICYHFWKLYYYLHRK